LTKFKKINLLFFLVITFSQKNIFANAYMRLNETFTPLFFKTLRRQKQKKSKIIIKIKKKNKQSITDESEPENLDVLKHFSIKVAKLVKSWSPENFFIIFKGFGGGFKKRHQTRDTLSKKREKILNAFDVLNLPISAIIDRSAISFNGCSKKKKRRKKKKFFKKVNRTL
jgi:hypothetical protein